MLLSVGDKVKDDKWGLGHVIPASKLSSFCHEHISSRTQDTHPLTNGRQGDRERFGLPVPCYHVPGIMFICDMRPVYFSMLCNWVSNVKSVLCGE